MKNGTANDTLALFASIGVGLIIFMVIVGISKVDSAQEPTYPVAYEYRHDYEQVKVLYDEWCYEAPDRERRRAIQEWLYSGLQMPVEAMPMHDLSMKEWVKRMRAERGWLTTAKGEE